MSQNAAPFNLELKTTYRIKNSFCLGRSSIWCRCYDTAFTDTDAESSKWSAVWKTLGNNDPLDPVHYLTLRAALEKGLEFEGKAVENYNNIAKKALEVNDFVTYNLATTILAAEVKDEQHTEDVLKNLEVK